MQRLLLAFLILTGFSSKALNVDCRQSLALTRGEAPSPRAFTALPAEQNSFGFSSKVHWIRLNCQNIPLVSPVYMEIDYPHLDDLQIFAANDLSRPLFRLGDRLPFEDRPLKVAHFAVPLTTETLASGVVLRVKTTSSIQLPIVFRSENEFIEHHLERRLLQGLYFGLMLAMVILNFWLFAMIREPMVLHYISYLSSFALLQVTMNGWAATYLFPSLPAFSNALLPMSVWLTFATMLQFFRVFLKTDQFAPRTSFILFILQFACFTMTGLSAFMPYAMVIRPAVYFGMISAPVLFALSLWISRRYTMAYFFAAAWVVFLAGTFILNLKNLGILTSNPWTDYSAQLGSALQILFLSAGVGFRLRMSEHEKRVSEMSRQVAHDIRAPLTALRVATDALPSTASAQAGLLHLAIGRIMEISEDLLSRSRDDETPMPNPKNHFNLVDLVAEVAQEARAIAKNVRIDLSVSQDEVWYYGAKADLKRALMNFVINSYEAESRWISIRLLHRGSETAIEIQDNGRGMTKHVLEQVRSGVSVTTKAKGSGLGLSSAFKTLHVNGARIVLDSRIGTGTYIQIAFPAAQGEPAPAEVTIA